MFAQSKPYPEMIELVARLKARYGLKIVVVSNEGRELNAYRIRKFKLDGLWMSFISSCFVHIRKPDADIFRLALDIAQHRRQSRWSISKTRRCSSRSRKVWGFEASFTRTTVHARENWLRWDCRMTNESIHETELNRRILTINGGSSSIKFALFEAGDALRRILEGRIERIGLPEATLRVKGVRPRRTTFRGL